MVGPAIRFVALAALLVGVVGCDLWSFGPSKAVTGNWQFTSGKSRIFEMSLTQVGDRISGTGCVYFVNPVTTPREFTVTGNYPVMHFDDPSAAACSHTSRYEEDRDQIAGDCEGRTLVRFSRGGSGVCAGAAPVR